MSAFLLRPVPAWARDLAVLAAFALVFAIAWICVEHVAVVLP